MASTTQSHDRSDGGAHPALQSCSCASGVAPPLQRLCGCARFERKDTAAEAAVPRRMRTSTGFTLVELLVVVGIIGSMTLMPYAENVGYSDGSVRFYFNSAGGTFKPD